MPTKGLPKFNIDSQHTETKENISSPLLLSKISGERMSRKRSLSYPGDPNDGDTAVLRLSQEANNSGNNSHIDAVEGTNVKDGKESNSRNVNSARLYAQSLQKVNARKQKNSKRMKISSENYSVVGSRLSEDGKFVTASFSACEQNTSQTPGNGHGSAAASESTVSSVAYIFDTGSH